MALGLAGVTERIPLLDLTEIGKIDLERFISENRAEIDEGISYCISISVGRRETAS
jgi:hypothetical protein